MHKCLVFIVVPLKKQRKKMNGKCYEKLRRSDSQGRIKE